MAERSEELSREIARLVDEKLGEDIVCLDMRELVTYTDYLVICTARNERQAESIADEVHLRLKQDRSLLPINPDRSGDVGWTVLDYLDCVLHIFTDEARQRYDLEDLWHEAPRVELGLQHSGSESASAA
jgi:ribosome-associated protein